MGQRKKRSAAFKAKVAVAVAAVVRGILRSTSLDEKIARWLLGEQRAKLDERLGEEAEGVKTALSASPGGVVYWLVFLLFLPAVLGALELEGLLTPVKAMTQQFLAFLPNVFGAALIVVLGWFAARIVQRVVTNLLAAVGADTLSEKVGLAKALGQAKLSRALGLVVQILILIPVFIAALNALQLEAVTRPTSNMLDVVLGAVPAIFAAALILLFSYVVGRLVAAAASRLLAGVGFDSILATLGLGEVDLTEGSKTPSDVVGYVIMVVVMLFASLEAARVLGFVALAELLAEFTVFAGQVLLGVVILAIGLWLANLAAKAVEATDKPKAATLAIAARVAILVLTTAIALRQMGLGDEIISLGFGLLLGAAAVAAAIAFGIGGRDVAKRKLDEWVK
ncbi:MAG: mechanosensitive ion channel [bacterium]